MMAENWGVHTFKLEGFDCREIVERVLARKNLWHEVSRIDRFYTLGKATYLHGWDLSLEDETRKTKDFLFREFPELYKRLDFFLEEHLQSPMTWDERLWTPGIHIFPSYETYRSKVSRVHVDVSYEFIDWKSLGYSGEVENFCTFTICLKQPSSKTCGIRMWKASTEDYRALESQPNPYEYVKDRECKEFLYRESEVIVHQGNLFHEILQFHGLSEEDYRITLQGHAVCIDGQWIVHW